MQANVGPTNASGNGVSVTPPTNKSISLGCLKKYQHYNQERFIQKMTLTWILIQYLLQLDTN